MSPNRRPPTSSAGRREPPSLWAEFARLAEAWRNGASLLLAFDFDGTLAPIVARPEHAQLAPTASETLARLAAVPRVSVAVVSGRSLDDLLPRVGLTKLHYVGSAGLEFAFGQERSCPAEAVRRAEHLPPLAELLTPLTTSYAGCWLERKTLSLTLHFREVPVDKHKELLRAAHASLDAEAARPITVGWRRHAGPAALELFPDLGWTKGSAIADLLRRLPAPALPLVAGDAENDADALELANRLGGLSLGVGPQPPSPARFCLYSPSDLVNVLSEFAAHLESL